MCFPLSLPSSGLCVVELFLPRFITACFFALVQYFNLWTEEIQSQQSNKRKRSDVPKCALNEVLITDEQLQPHYIECAALTLQDRKRNFAFLNYQYTHYLFFGVVGSATPKVNRVKACLCSNTIHTDPGREFSIEFLKFLQAQYDPSYYYTILRTTRVYFVPVVALK